MPLKVGHVPDDGRTEFDETPPEASAFMGSIRASGYDLETAVADIVDNSISAGARNVRITVSAEGRGSWLAILDDGCGMDETALIRAMTLGGISPAALREPQDLGRFGLGLKTASLSQCRRLTVFSKAVNHKTCVRCWDIDFVDQTNRWALLRSCHSPQLEERFRQELQRLASGTIVLWEVLDHITHNGTDAEIALRLSQRVPVLDRHLAMVFHRFLEEPNGLRIRIGDLAVAPYDPFMRKEKATQMLGEETLEYQGQRILVRPYVLPHMSKLTDSDQAVGKGARRWTDQQGFYVYRNRRLLVSGSWLRLGFGKEEHNKLVRIQLDFPNQLDFEWDIDIRKARAEPPDALRQDLIRIAKRAREVSRAIFHHRGASIARQFSDHIFLWQKKVAHNKVSYQINRSHPAVKAALAAAKSARISETISALFRLIEQTIPVPLILIDGSEQPDAIAQPTHANAEVREFFVALHSTLCQAGQTPREAFEHLAMTEPFHRYPEMLATLQESLS